ncbi:MAG: hypothetical protein AAF480_02430 [Actinomycetota bacterium]
MGRVLKGTIVLDTSEEEAGPGVNDATAAAYEQGRIDGAAEAVAGLDASMAELTAALAATAAQTASAVATSHRLDGETIVTLAADLVSWYLDQAGPELDESVRAAVTQAIVALEGEPDLVVSLAPEVAERMDALPSVEVRSDPTLGPADFRLQAADGAVERSWHDAVDRLRPALVQALTRTHDG